MIIGLTGGIGTGKSTVSRYLKSKNYIVIDADLISREIVESPEVITEIKKEFGSEIELDGVFDRKALRTIVFSSREKVAKLNSILHPLIIDRIKEDIKKHMREELIFLDIPLLFECRLEYLSDFILLVYSDLEVQIERVMARDKVDREDAVNIIDKQMDMEFKKKHSNYVLNNNEDISKLEYLIDNFLTYIKEEENAYKN